MKIAVKLEHLNNSNLTAILVWSIGYKSIGFYSQLPIKTKGDQ
jgi:hypothetical protein